MDIVVDANIYLVVILNEPEKSNIIERTKKVELVSPEVLPYEIGNALVAMSKRKRLNKEEILRGFNIFNMIPLRLVSVNIEKALDIAYTFNIYMYDAYYLELAQRLKVPLLTLDNQMQDIAKTLKIKLLEVEL